MHVLPRCATSLLATLLAFAATHSLRAGDTTASSTTASSIAVTTADTRYGLFGLLDHRSSYGQNVFPEPFLIDDSDAEDTELRLSWFHAKAGPARTDVATAEFEKGFGPATFEIEIPYERDASPDGVMQGVGNVELSVRCPFYQYVAPSGSFDFTFGAAMEFGIPTTSQISKNAEYVPRIFNDLRIGSHITLQSTAGYSILAGPGEDSGLHTFEYGFLLGYTFQHKELPIPGVQQFIPVFEVSGERPLNHDDRHNSVLASVGFRANMKAIGPIQSRIGVAYVFPMNQPAREDVHQGIITSLIFEF